MDKPTKYRLYIDEVGNPDLKSSKNPNHRFLSLTGVILDLYYVEKTVHPEMESLKKKYFQHHPDDPVIFHRKEIVNKQFAFECLHDNNIRDMFDCELLKLLSTWNYTVITVCIDKKVHMDTYVTWRYHPYHYCLAVMLERYVFFLKSAGGVGDVMAESRGGKEDGKLKESFNNLFTKGTEYLSPNLFSRYLTSSQLKVKIKQNNISGLQLADILAHPSWCEILSEQKLFSRNLTNFALRIIETLQSKYYRNGDKIMGYGKKFIG